MKNKSLFALIFIILTLANLPVLAGTYWVSNNGTASWAACQSATPLSGTSCCNIATANANASAGDVVYLRGGTYPFSTLNGRHLVPQKSGTSSAYVVFKNYPGETPELKGTYEIRMWGLMIQDVSYVQIDGLVFSDYTDNLVSTGAHHIEIKNCTFRNVTSPFRRGGFHMLEACKGGSASNCPVSHIWVHHNTFYKLAAGGGCDVKISEGGDAVRIGYPSNVSPTPTGDNSHITIENNYMAYAGHAVMDSYGQYCVFKNNVAHNEPWYPADNGACTVAYQPSYTNASYNGLYSHRIWHFTDTFNRNRVFNLIEGNRLGHSGVNPNNNGATCLAVASCGNIVRFNALYDAMHNNMKCKYGDNYGWQSKGGSRNMIYSNTLYKAGYGYPTFENQYPWPNPLHGFRYYAPNDEPGNIFMNNIVFGSYAGDHGTDDIEVNKSTPPSIEVNNWTTNNGNGSVGYGNPKFVNPDLTQTSSLTLPDLRVQTGSPVIDKGIFLTTVTAVSDQTHITLDNPYFFQDGTWGADMTHGVTLFPDWVAIGTATNFAQIRSIDYQTGAVELAAAPAAQINTGDRVWLYKNSSGQIVLSGAAPDIGAYEYIPNATQSVNLVTGWNWISFNVLPADLSLNSIFAGILAQIEQVKAQTQSAIRVGGAWKGDLADMNGIGQYKMYKVKVTQACTLTVTGTAVLSATPIQLAGGWNWVAYLPTTSISITTALASISGQVLEVKSLTQSATYSGGSWSGTLTQLEPGQGYAIKMNGPGTLTYPAGQ